MPHAWTLWRSRTGLPAFEGCAKEYARARPGYPEEVGKELLKRLRLRRGARVLDLGAGTGISTRFLRRLGLRVVPLEPGMEMIRQGQQRAVRARAEQLPFREKRFDAVIAVQSFHWVDPRRALPECARVARGLGILWTQRADHPVWEGLHRLIRSVNPSYGRWKGDPDRRWRRILGRSARRTGHRFEWTYDKHSLVAYALSLSYLRNRLLARQVPGVIRKVRAIWEKQGRVRAPLPFVVQLWTLTSSRRA